MDIFDKEKTVISCFDLTGNMVRPWAEAGYLCYCVDIQHPQGETRQGNIIHVGADMRDWLPPFRPITFAAFFPPCTDVAVSGLHPPRGMDTCAVPHRKPRFHHLHLLAQVGLHLRSL